MLEVDVNQFAVLVAAIVGMGIGALWYSPLLFGEAWMKLSGKTKADMKKAKKAMTKTYLSGFAGMLVTSFVLAAFLNSLGASRAVEGAFVGFWLWLGFVATVMLGMILWENKPVKLYLINAVHYLVVLVVIGTILAVWS